MTLDNTNSFYCRKPNGVYTRVRWKRFYVICPKVHLTCYTQSWAYVPAITVCNQNLWTGWSDEGDLE